MRIAFALIALLTATVTQADPVPYRLLADESRVGFTWFFGDDPVNGRMSVQSADIVIDIERVTDSRVAVTLDVANSEAGFPFANQAMKAKNMLWTERFPTITFRSTSVSGDPSGVRISGDLTVRGVTRPIVMNAGFFRRPGDTSQDPNERAIRLTGAISRAAFGAAGWPNDVGDEVRLDILALIARAG